MGEEMKAMARRRRREDADEIGSRQIKVLIGFHLRWNPRHLRAIA
jgi:hypothetical protein